MTRRPTRSQLLDLAHGELITHGDMRAYRAPVDPGVRKKQVDPREVHFSKHYLEGKLTITIIDEAIGDMLPDPWVFAEERLDEIARSRKAHYRGGNPVR